MLRDGSRRVEAPAAAGLDTTSIDPTSIDGIGSTDVMLMDEAGAVTNSIRQMWAFTSSSVNDGRFVVKPGSRPALPSSSLGGMSVLVWSPQWSPGRLGLTTRNTPHPL
jgi:hypothetical protein